MSLCALRRRPQRPSLPLVAFSEASDPSPTPPYSPLITVSPPLPPRPSCRAAGRFVPRAFDAILRHSAPELLPNRSPKLAATEGTEGLRIEVTDLPGAIASTIDVSAMVMAPVPTDLPKCQTALIEARAALTEVQRQRDAYKVTRTQCARQLVCRAHQ